MNKIVLYILIIFFLAGCTQLAVIDEANVKSGYDKPVRELFVIVNSNGIPRYFPNTFAFKLEEILNQRKIPNYVSVISDLDLEPIDTKKLSTHSHLLIIRTNRTEYLESQLRSLTLLSTLIDLDDNKPAVKAEITAIKG